MATANENKTKCNSCKNEGKELLTFRIPQVGRDLWQEIPSLPLPTPKQGLGRGGSWFHPFWSLHAPELPWVGPAFPPGAQSVFQAMIQHFHYKQGHLQ